ncbi:hypothetical protein ISCGN_010620 [Ixodes scapularis]
MRLHESKLSVKEDGPLLLANGAINPQARTVYYWHDLWRREHFGSSVDPVKKIQEKIPLYASHGIDVKVQAEEGTPWAVLVVTPIMRRMQEHNSACEVIFIDSTSSCDAGQSTTTVLLAATKAGAIPIAVLIHNFQSTDGRVEVANIKRKWCRQEGKKAADVCIPRNTAEKLAEAKQKLECVPHERYIARVQDFLQKEQEWVLLFRKSITTRGHNTNNFAEACIRILKDIVLCRTRAFNAAAPVDFVSHVWESYFQGRLLKHANNGVAGHNIFYEKLLKKMPEETTILTDGDGIYTVTSATDNAKTYEVFPDVGLCTCRAGGQGAFCKHQAVVHRTVGGVLPNAPVLTPRDRRDLGRLALWENAPPISFYADIHEAVTPDTSDNPVHATSLQESLDAEPSTSSFQSNLDNKEALTQTPAAFMTDNSSAEKAALRTTWPGATQLLCHFHVAQAEWRWLTSKENGVDKKERRQLMSAFQETLPRSWLRQSKNLNVYHMKAPVDFVSHVWESYFQGRLLKHANNGVAGHNIFYEKLLKKMPEETTILTDGDGIYTVTSATDNGKTYKVFPDVGLCTCRAGGQGAFCKHQAVVHRTVGGVLPNAPVLTPRDRRDLGRLALWENGPPISFYADIHEAVTPDTSDNPVHATSLQESLDAEPSTSSFQSNLDNKEALTQNAKFVVFLDKE